MCNTLYHMTVASVTYITNLDGDVVQHIEYVPFGEVFIEERNNDFFKCLTNIENVIYNKKVSIVFLDFL